MIGAEPGEVSFDFTGPAGAQTGALRLVPGGGARPLVLACHGGSGHKRSAEMTSVALALTSAGVAHVAAIDGPVHGENSEHGGDASLVILDFRALWDARQGEIDRAVADWSAALEVLVQRDDVVATSLGWFGLSMGTAYGVPFLAGHPDVRAAVLGEWSFVYPNSEKIEQAAPLVASALLFVERDDDQRFTSTDQRVFFDRLGSGLNDPGRKEHRHYPGGHGAAGAAEISDAVEFFAAELRTGKV